jgi:polar amino acid transport system ATP-binding protein
MSIVMEFPLIEIRELKKAFHGNPVLRGVDLQIDSGKLTVMIGPSGCGKSTLLRCLNGIETFDEGRISIAGVTLEKHGASTRNLKEYRRTTYQLRKTVGMVFQSFNLFPHMSALDNVANPPVIVKGISRTEARREALELLRKVGLKDKAALYPAQLSGGQQQRAAIARALAMKPTVLLYDEPTSALDPSLVDEVLEVMKELDSEGITQLVVTHEMRFARNVAEKIVFMSEGRIVEEGPPEQIFTNPSDSRTRQFLHRFI